MSRIKAVPDATLICLFLLLTGLLPGCSSLRSDFNVSRLLDEARTAGFETFKSHYPGLILSRQAGGTSRELWIFLEGDGTPVGWAHRLTNLPWGISKNCVDSM